MANEYYQSSYTGEQIDNAVGRIVNGEIDQLADSAYASSTAAESSASSAASSASAAQSAYSGVQAALNSLPDGDTLIINDLTTGGTKAALSAEMGKTLNSGKVSNAGDTMRGALTVKTDNYPAVNLNTMSANGRGLIRKNASATSDTGTQLVDLDASGNQATLSLRGYRHAHLADVLKLAVRNSGGSDVWYDILHTGNKPSGFYTGNGDATERRIATGGTGNVVAIWGGNQVTILTANGGFNYSQSTAAVTGVPIASGRFNSGTIIIATSAGSVNANGVTYNYQVL